MASSINEGIAMACREGIVTNTSLLPAGKAFGDAVDKVRELGLTEVGVHLALTEVSSQFHRHHSDLFLDIVLKKIGEDYIYSELKAQLETAVRSGIKITNLSSHEHIHMFPAILGTFIRLAKEFGIGAIRYLGGDRPASLLDIRSLYRAAVLSIFSPGMKRAFVRSGVRHADYLMGFVDSGRMKEGTLTKIIELLKNGVTELVVHPGFISPEVLEEYPFHTDCETELAALTGRRVSKLIEALDIKLMKYSEIAET